MSALSDAFGPGHAAEMYVIDHPAGGGPTRRKYDDATAFTRSELTRILGLYGQFVAAGEWRDYAIDHLRDAAVFSIFRRTSEAPLYRIEKRPSLSRRQGAWAVVSVTGAVLKRGHDLAQVLRVFDKKRLRLAD
ncbi:MAG: DUF2794 domain-containing protein [Parvularculaceae bacterium]|nr:MAG: DUF2794 domain-containing protein [Parvularculaceae bacterium]